VEVVDGITDLDGYAWLAVASFDPRVIRIPKHPVGEAGSADADLYKLAGRLQLKDLTGEILAAADPKNPNLTVRLGAIEALAMLEPQRAIDPLTGILGDATVPTSSREKAAEQLSQIDRAEARTALLSQLKSAPESVAVLIAAGLASNRDSAQALFKEIDAGRAPATLLREPPVVDKLKACGLPDVEKQIEKLTANLSPKDSRIEKLIAKRRAHYLAGQFDSEKGRAVFAKSICASCHRIGDVGKTLGPALDGIGNRGLDRLLEDTLDPSRNVDAAFRTVTIETENGQIFTGFGLVFNDSNGQQVRVPLAEVADRRPSALSPMPSNVIEQMSERDYDALMAYLLSLKGK
jgi:putative heme-binding domain-containing protein